jgi:hypothetical protein
MKLIKLFIVALILSSCEVPQYEEVLIQEVIVKKYVEQECYNNFGAFEMNHYFLYENGDLDEVKLKDYVQYEVGDTVSWVIHNQIN